MSPAAADFGGEFGDYDIERDQSLVKPART